MVQGPLVSSLGETVAVSTCTQYSMVRAEMSCRNVNASRCHTALQHIDYSEVWSTFFIFVDKIYNQKPMKEVKIHDLLLSKRTKHNFGNNMYKSDGFWSKRMDCRQWPKMVYWSPPQKLKIFQVLLFLTKKHGLQFMKLTKIYVFEKKKMFLKNLKIDGFWPELIDYNS